MKFEMKKRMDQLNKYSHLILTTILSGYWVNKYGRNEDGKIVTGWNDHLMGYSSDYLIACIIVYEFGWYRVQKHDLLMNKLIANVFK
tara:strand:- start:9322 stop:9582 length:261 start_codon:yes stop_codon:yes gene_type:complete